MAVVYANRIVAASPGARAQGVARGCGAVPPRVGAPRLSFTNVTRPVKLDCSSRSSLHSTTSPHGSKSPGPARVRSRCGGHRHFGGDAAVADLVHERLAEVVAERTDVRVGVADGPFAAELAARAANPTRLVPSGEVAGFSLR